MRRPPFIKQCKRLFFPAMCLILAGCGPLTIDTDLESSSADGVIVHADGRGHYSCENGDLYFTGYSSSEIEFIDQFGKNRNERTFGLWIAIEKQPESHLYFRAYEGLTIYYYSYTLRVLCVGYQSSYVDIEVDCGEEAELP